MFFSFLQEFDCLSGLARVLNVVKLGDRPFSYHCPDKKELELKKKNSSRDHKNLVTN